MTKQFEAVVPFASASRVLASSPVSSADFITPEGYDGVELFLDVTAESGTTPTLNVKMQAKDPIGGLYVDMSGVAFAQVGETTGNFRLVVRPGLVNVANLVKADSMPETWKLVATLTGTLANYTFSVGGYYISSRSGLANQNG